MAIRPGMTVGSVTPPAIASVTKIVEVTRSDTTAFDAFVLPKGARLAGAYVIGSTASDAGTSAAITLGSNPGTTNEVFNGYDVKTAASGAGYNTIPGSKIGSGWTAVASSDILIKAKYTEAGTASTTGGPWLVKVEYYFPQSGQSH